RRF
ncbi:hypothetical protein D027_3980B, partial [Vibrio parahaemolyticus 861]